MECDLKVRVLIENTAGGMGLIAQHGLSFLLETDAGWRILFDAGQSRSALSTNCRLMGIEPEDIDAIVISHGHYDHAAGLNWVLPKALDAPVIMHPDALLPKFSVRQGEPPRYIGIPDGVREKLEEPGRQLHLTDTPTEVAPAVYFLGQVERKTDFEVIEPRFKADALGKEPDRMLDDSALVVRTRKGLVILAGCAHSGVINMLSHVRRLWRGEKVRALLGGIHLTDGDEDRIERTGRFLLGLQPEVLALGHCTGLRAVTHLSRLFGPKLQPLIVGSVFDL